MENFIISLSCVTPMFLVICTGILLRRANLVPTETFRNLSTITFNALLPCLVFNTVYNADLSSAVQPRMLVFLLVFLVSWFILNSLWFAKHEPDFRQRGAMIQNSYRSNAGVIGLSLAQSLMGPDGLAAMAVALSMIPPLYNALAVITLETCRGGKPDLKQTIRNIARNPMIIGCLLGFVPHILGFRFPAPVDRAIANLSTAGSIMALLSLGGSLAFDGLKKNLRPLAFGCVHRLVTTPLLAVSIAAMLGFRGDLLGCIMVSTAAPLAVASYPMAVAYDSDHELTSQLVVCTSLLCNLTLFLWVFALKQFELI